MTQGSTVASTTLESEWIGLSPHLIASFYEVDDKGKRLAGPAVTVKAPLTEAEMEATMNWQSPFENTGPESKAPTLIAMLQSGMLQPVLDAIPGLGDSSDENSLRSKLGHAVEKLEGRAGITKLNSTQIFTGMAPVKFQVTALFRAWKDPAKEVEAPFNQLMQWALPVKLADSSTILTRAAEGQDGVTVVLPSEAPTLIAMHYKGRTFAPLVIESIGMPLSSPIDGNGNFAELMVPMTLCSLTALDRQDWTSSKRTAL